MPPITKVTDQPKLVDTKEYKLARWPYPQFNPVQSRVYEFYDRDCNSVVAAATSAGKTTVAEMILAHEIRVRGGKGMFLGPLKALTQEKIDNWTDIKHHFADKKIAICTGDYRLTPDRKSELDAADLIIMTTEMLNHRSRNFKSENNTFLSKVGCLVIDESHLLTVPGRGDHLEAGLMKFTKINPGCRIVLLSATMPNVDEIGEWVSYALTGRETYVLHSSYRPCPLNIHFEKVWDQAGSYAANEEEKISYARDIIGHYPDDKFLIFSHTIDTGFAMCRALQEDGIQAEFHYSGLKKDDRIALEHRFKQDKNLRCIVATSTLAWGMNLPARRVIILGVHRGFDVVESYNIQQMVGRAGRVGLDPMGDAYILLPERQYDMHKSRLKTPEPIISHLLDESAGGKYKTLAFHLVSEIHHGDITTREEVHDWYERSFAHFQKNKLDDTVVDTVVDDLKKCFAIKEEDGVLKATAVGMVSSMFYFSPFDVSDLRRNFKHLFESNTEGDDISVSLALSNIDSNATGFANKREKEEMAAFQARVQARYGNRYPESVVKVAFAYHGLMNGQTNKSPLMRQIAHEYNRLSQVLFSLDQMSGKWGKRAFFNNLQSRMAHGVSSDLVDLVQLPGISKVRARKLYESGIKTLEDVAASPEKVKKALGMKSQKVQEIVEEANKLLLTGGAGS